MAQDVALFADMLVALKRAERFIDTALRHSISKDVFNSDAEYEQCVAEHLTLKRVREVIARAEKAGNPQRAETPVQRETEETSHGS